jgi:hypothetical protein
MKQSIGFLSIEISDNTESNFIINYLNSLATKYPYTDMILFNSVYNKPSENLNKFSVLHINEARFFTGPIFAFNLKNMLFLKHCIGKKIFYSLRPEWLTLNKDINYMDLKSLYTDGCDTLIIPDQQYEELYSLCWKDPVVIEPSDYQKVMKYAKL